MPVSSRPGTGRSRGAVDAAGQHDRRRTRAAARRRGTSTPTLALGAEHRRLPPPCSASRRSRNALLQLELGDAVAQQPADAIGALEHGHRVAGAVQLLGGGQARRARIRRPRRACRCASPAAAASTQPSSNARSMIDDLDRLDRHRVVVDAEHARALARRRTQPAGELREVVRRVQPLDRRLPAIAVDEIVPVGIRLPSGQP